MKNLLIIIFTLPIFAIAQIDTLPWCPSGATWIYEYVGLYLYKAEYVGDTMLLDKNAKKIVFSRSIISEQIDSFEFQYEAYMSQENDTLFIYRDQREMYNVALGPIYRNERWDILCAYNGVEGDTWLHKEETNVCDSIDTISINTIDTTRIGNAPFLSVEYSLSGVYTDVGSF
ncbi:MAG: hypothetical protein R2777_05950, partial [Chitinophagales bacterium]